MLVDRLGLGLGQGLSLVLSHLSLRLGVGLTQKLHRVADGLLRLWCNGWLNIGLSLRKVEALEEIVDCHGVHAVKSLSLCQSSLNSIDLVGLRHSSL